MAPQPFPPTIGPVKRRYRPLRCLAFLLISLIIFFGLVILIFYLSVRPTTISYSVDDAHIRNYNLSSGELNATFDFTLLAPAPIYYDSVAVAVWYDDQMLAFRELPPFYQPKRNATRLVLALSATAAPLLGPVAEGLKHDRSAGEVALEVRVRALIRFKVGAAKTKHYVMRVYCAPVVVRFSPAEGFQRSFCDVDV
ncbi:NDR1/HIN1-like protein 10 [Phalaenopsis equestris]|uniref:NDR1/HIN1-like protein 10 n=1 Tax=Phalaenopsis equestris TaxID=78828 RepID=UPI0009E28BEA|nr:NDR1/HIN1-like protein 10 [Phalaenopsis equestris]